MSVLITGASSLPGYRTTLTMLKHGLDVVRTYLTHEIPIEHKHLHKVQVDITNINKLKAAVEKYKPTSYYA